MDDGSTDGTSELLHAWAADDPRVRVLRQRPLGPVPALEAARSHARGRYLARMDADDVAAPERLERQLALMEASPEVVLCGCGVRYFPEPAVQGGARRYEAWINALVAPEQIERDAVVEPSEAYYRDIGLPTSKVITFDSPDHYVDWLHESPAEFVADALVYTAQVLVIRPPSDAWAIWAQRDVEVAVRPCSMTKR